MPKESYVIELKDLNNDIDQFNNGKLASKGPKMLYCITMYQETWSQVLQSIAGCVRSIFELEEENPEEYSAE